MKIHNIPISDLIPYANNPRINDAAVEPVAESIKEFGFKVPMVVTVDNVIITGHTRLKAAKMLGLTEVPCVIADDLTDAQIKAFRLADNKSSELSQWDFEALEKELDGLSDLHDSLATIGFELTTDFDLDDFFKQAPKTEAIPEEPPEETEISPAEAQEPIVETPIEELEQTESPEQIVCPYCGHILEPGDLDG